MIKKCLALTIGASILMSTCSFANEPLNSNANNMNIVNLKENNISKNNKETTSISSNIKSESNIITESNLPKPIITPQNDSTMIKNSSTNLSTESSSLGDIVESNETEIKKSSDSKNESIFDKDPDIKIKPIIEEKEDKNLIVSIGKSVFDEGSDIEFEIPEADQPQIIVKPAEGVIPEGDNIVSTDPVDESQFNVEVPETNPDSDPTPGIIIGPWNGEVPEGNNTVTTGPTDDSQFNVEGPDFIEETDPDSDPIPGIIVKPWDGEVPEGNNTVTTGPTDDSQFNVEGPDVIIGSDGDSDPTPGIIIKPWDGEVPEGNNTVTTGPADDSQFNVEGPDVVIGSDGDEIDIGSDANQKDEEINSDSQSNENENLKLEKAELPDRTNPIKADSNGLIIIDKNEIIDFYFPSSVNNVELNNIAPEAFKGCSLFKSVTIPKNITNIGDNAFAECPNLEFIILEGRSDCTGMILGENWFGNAKVIFEYVLLEYGVVEESPIGKGECNMPTFNKDIIVVEDIESEPIQEESPINNEEQSIPANKEEFVIEKEDEIE